jgi:hypothetical protein
MFQSVKRQSEIVWVGPQSRTRTVQPSRQCKVAFLSRRGADIVHDVHVISREKRQRLTLIEE